MPGGESQGGVGTAENGRGLSSPKDRASRFIDKPAPAMLTCPGATPALNPKCTPARGGMAQRCRSR